MTPAFRPGDRVLARKGRRHPREGEVVVFEHPSRPGFFLIKRVQIVAPDGDLWVVSDANDTTMADSRTLGWIHGWTCWRVIWRLPGGRP